MIVSPAAGLPFAEPAAAPAQNAAGGDGKAFALAVKDASREKTPADPAKAEKPADGENPDVPARKTRAKTASDNDGKAETKGETDKDGEAAASLTGDVLGRLLGAALAAPVAQGIAADGEAAQEKAGEDGEMQERLVISTVVDLAGAAETGEPVKGRVALEVLRMETHFEPGAGTAELVQGAKEPAAEPLADLAALAQDAAEMAAKPRETTAPAPKMSFDEALQKLGGQWTGGGSETSGGEAGQQGNREGAQAKSAAKTGRTGDGMASLRATLAASTADKSAAIAYPSMTDQVAHRIIEALAPGSAGSADTANRPAAGTDAYLRMTAGGAALKTLTIQLQPENLGQLDVSMRLVDGRLTLELAATRNETAQALAADKHGLKKLLEHAGFAVDDAAITVVTRERPSVGQAASADGANGGTSTGSDGGQRSASQQQNAESGRNPQRQQPDARAPVPERAAAAGTAPGGRGVFL